MQLLPAIAQAFLLGAIAGATPQSRLPSGSHEPGALSERERIDQLARRYAELGLLEGAIGVARRGELVYQAAFGLANRELGVQNTLATRFQVASITKTFTAMLVLRLIDRGVLAFDSTLADCLPELPFPRADELTLERLLTHTSGLQRDIADFPPHTNAFPDRVAKINADFFSLEELVAMIAARPLAHAPGERFDYSSDGYGVLGLVVARFLETTYQQALQEEILGPLGLGNTGYVSQLAVLEGRASGYERGFGGLENARRIGISPAGGMNSTVPDLLELDHALFGDVPMSAAAKSRAWAPSELITAYGWKVRPDPGGAGESPLFVQASGALPGFRALFTRTLSDGLCVVVLTNQSSIQFTLDDITDGVLDILRGREPARPRRSAALELGELLRTRGPDAARAAFSAWQKEHFDGIELDEPELNSLGYHWLAARDFPKALAALELNAAHFPESVNAHDSLGEALTAAGRTEEARKAWQRVLELDPGNARARSILNGASPEPR